MKTLAYGFPRLGQNREYKTLLEGLWNGKTNLTEWEEGIQRLEADRLATYKRYVDLYPAEFSYYDPMLDMAVTLGVIPKRFRDKKGWEQYYAMARGKNALEMTKWFNTNYHYLVPELSPDSFSEQENLIPLQEFRRGKKLQFTPLPSIIGPYTFVRLSKREGEGMGREIPANERGKLMRDLLPRYKNLLDQFLKEGAEIILIHEPAFTFELTPEEKEEIGFIYQELSPYPFYLLSYYDAVDDLSWYLSLPSKGISLDLYHYPDLLSLRKKVPPIDKTVLLGVVSGRSVFVTDYKKVVETVESLLPLFPNLILTNTHPLYHLPVTVDLETKLPSFLKERVAFAKERLKELSFFKRYFSQDPSAQEELKRRSLLLSTPLGEDKTVETVLNSLSRESFTREKPYKERILLQKKIVPLPKFPTTTIGSFPQTEEVRKNRSLYRQGKLTEEEYERWLKEEIRKLIQIQEELELDVLVHGEFERTDMVEFFAEKLKGVAVTDHGWVLSYGSRVYRPPIIYGYVSRKGPMTVKEIQFAQSLTEKPVKGMLTGPVTILNWSYIREDLPKEKIAYSIALALKEEVSDLEKAGIRIIQIDEPAFREGAPIKKRNWKEYFDWAISAFRLASNAKPETQIHTHMCYSEFHEILSEIYAMDFDVISIEASRSKGELVEAFKNLPEWDRGIGIGVYDIHSPAIPSEKEIEEVLKKVLSILPEDLIWVNPDCGLKTRRWDEVIPSLKNMVNATKKVRKEYASK